MSTEQQCTNRAIECSLLKLYKDYRSKTRTTKWPGPLPFEEFLNSTYTFPRARPRSENQIASDGHSKVITSLIGNKIEVYSHLAHSMATEVQETKKEVGALQEVNSLEGKSTKDG